MQTKNPVLTRRAQLPQMPPPSWGFREKDQGFVENRLWAWGIKRRVARFWALDSRPCLTGQRTGPRHTLSCLERSYTQLPPAITPSNLLPPIRSLQSDCSSSNEAPGLQENRDVFLELHFSSLLAKSGTDRSTGVGGAVNGLFPVIFPICSSHIKLGVSLYFGESICAYCYVLLLLSL